MDKYVHEAVLAAKEERSEVTFHLVTENYDEGAIVAQKKYLYLKKICQRL